MFFKKYNKEFPKEILVLSGIAEGDHYTFQYNGEDYIEVKLINGDKSLCEWWDTYTENELYKLFFDGSVEYIECSLEQFNKMKLFI